MTKAFNSKKMANFWNTEAKVYSSQHDSKKIYPMQDIRNKYIIDLFDMEPGKHVDIGCGPGYTLIPLLQKGWTDVQGLDISDEMLSRAKKNIKEAGFDSDNMPFQIGDIENLPFGDNTFDTVACIAVIEYLQKDDKALAELSRILKPGGTLVIVVRNKRCLYRLVDAFRFLRSNIRTKLGSKKFEGMEFKDGNGIWYKKHCPAKFKKDLKAHGLVQNAFRYFHYYLTPVPLESFLGRFSASVAVKLEALNSNPISKYMASGYIVRCTKEKEGYKDG